jgi:hypothetical protein
MTTLAQIWLFCHLAVIADELACLWPLATAA